MPRECGSLIFLARHRQGTELNVEFDISRKPLDCVLRNLTSNGYPSTRNELEGSISKTYRREERWELFGPHGNDACTEMHHEEREVPVRQEAVKIGVMLHMLLLEANKLGMRRQISPNSRIASARSICTSLPSSTPPPHNFGFTSMAALASLLTTTSPFFFPSPKKITSTVKSSRYLLLYGAGSVSNAHTISLSLPPNAFRTR